MPSDARILREYGRAGLLLWYAEKSRLRRQRALERDPDALHEYERQKAAKRRAKVGAPHPIPFDPMRTCRVCATTFLRLRDARGKLRNGVTCSETCRRAAISMTWRSRNTRRIWPTCNISVKPCVRCGTLFTQHGNLGYCSAECRRLATNDAQRSTMREYQRRTRKTAIRYWTLDQSPEALALAETYYQLRQELVYRRHPERNQRYGPVYRGQDDRGPRSGNDLLPG